MKLRIKGNGDSRKFPSFHQMTGGSVILFAGDEIRNGFCHSGRKK